MNVSNRYVIGIDLGTTNSAVAYLDRHSAGDGHEPSIIPFDIPQLVAPGVIEPRPTLPSFLYFPRLAERQAGGLSLPWETHPDAIVGVLAREQGTLAPGQLVASAKSWLCHGEVDRTADILPWGAEHPTQTCSPVAASSRYLAHIRDAWNHIVAASGGEAERFERQDIVLTVPASFDAEARELTVQAARDAGLEHLTLLEEPQAAFYAWGSAHRSSLTQDLHDGDVVLVCDVGGGTTDLSLLRVCIEAGEVQLERTAIGEHVLLGGDNVDLALAHHLDAKLGHPSLTLRQRQALRRQSCVAKEHLLGQAELERVPIGLLGSGSAMVGGTLRTELTRDEVVATLLDGFLPFVSSHDRPRRDRRTGLRELGLPYASEPAITRHLASFLSAATPANVPEGARQTDGQAAMTCPDAVLFNGGFFAPAFTRERLLAVIASWFPEKGADWRPRELDNPALATAVATGAAYYGHVRRSGGWRIGGGSARAYYIGIHSDSDLDNAPARGVCVLPRGTEEGTELGLAHRVFTVLTNRPVSFTLYSSTTRRDAHSEVVRLNDQEYHRHAPLLTVLRYGRRSQQMELPVQVTAHYTEVGTLELWCQSQHTEHRWRLQFQLRGAVAPQDAEAAASATQTLISDAAVAHAERLIRAVFGRPQERPADEPSAPEALMGNLEAALGYGRDAWPLTTIRKLCDVLLDVAEGRKKTKQAEARWLNLFGFCLRPGFSVALDTWRIEQTRKCYAEGLTYASHPECLIQWLILWRRVAGGLNAGQQREIYQRHLGLVGLGGKARGKRHNPQVEFECWRLLASLERLAVPERVRLGQELLKRIEVHPTQKSTLWALGRLGARLPFAGPLNCVVPAEIAGAWLEALLHLDRITPDTVSAIVQLGARTEDPARDIPETLRQEALTTLQRAGVSDAEVQSLRDYVPPTRRDAVRIFGDTLPEGLRLVDSPADAADR